MLAFFRDCSANSIATSLNRRVRWRANYAFVNHLTFIYLVTTITACSNQICHQTDPDLALMMLATVCLCVSAWPLHDVNHRVARFFQINCCLFVIFVACPLHRITYIVFWGWFSHGRLRPAQAPMG